MKIKKISAFIIIAAYALLSGCGRINYPGLPDNPEAFEMGTFTDNEHDDAMFGSIVFNGRTYISYGTVRSALKQEYLSECVGYIIQDENSYSPADPDNKAVRIYTLAGDTENNFLLEHYNGFMSTPADFMRAVDTKGKDIEIPEYIESLGYGFWETGK